MSPLAQQFRDTLQCRCGHSRTTHRGKGFDGRCKECDACEGFGPGETLVCKNTSDGREHGIPPTALGKYALLCGLCRREAAERHREALRLGAIAAAERRSGDAQAAMASIFCEHRNCTRDAAKGSAFCEEHAPLVAKLDAGPLLRDVLARQDEKAAYLEALKGVAMNASSVTSLEEALATAIKWRDEAVQAVADARRELAEQRKRLRRSVAHLETLSEPR